MAPFRYGEDDLQHPLDWVLLQDGPVTLYRRLHLLDADVAELGGLGYEVHRFDCSRWQSSSMHEDFRRELPGFEDYSGLNLYALDDGLRGLPVPEEGGMVIVFENFGQIPEREEPEILLDSFAKASRLWSLFGRRLIVLVQIDDPAFTGPESLGAMPAEWNRREWMIADRYTRSEIVESCLPLDAEKYLQRKHMEP